MIARKIRRPSHVSGVALQGFEEAADDAAGLIFLFGDPCRLQILVRGGASLLSRHQGQTAFQSCLGHRAAAQWSQRVVPADDFDQGFLGDGLRG